MLPNDLHDSIIVEQAVINLKYLLLLIHLPLQLHIQLPQRPHLLLEILQFTGHPLAGSEHQLEYGLEQQSYLLYQFRLFVILVEKSGAESFLDYEQTLLLCDVVVRYYVVLPHKILHGYFYRFAQ